MSHNDFVACAILIGICTVMFSLASIYANKKNKFSLVKSLGLRKGVYEHVETGKMIEIVALRGDSVLVKQGVGLNVMLAYEIDVRYRFLESKSGREV